MHDWRETVHEHLQADELPPAEREEVISELAAHLEETYQDARSQGMTDAIAIEFALQEVGLQEVEDWHVLAAKIHHAKSAEDPMNHRTKSFWLPALASFAAASLFLLVLTQVSMQPRFLVRLNSGLGRSFYFGWLFAQVLFGALGAFLSRRAGGTRTARVIAAIFPAIVTFGVWAFVIPISALGEHNTFVLRHPLYYALGFFVWVVPPGITLLLGAAPFLRESKLQRA